MGVCFRNRYYIYSFFGGDREIVTLVSSELNGITFHSKISDRTRVRLLLNHTKFVDKNTRERIKYGMLTVRNVRCSGVEGQQRRTKGKYAERFRETEGRLMS